VRTPDRDILCESVTSERRTATVCSTLRAPERS
jgi:hypothetical protein